MMQRFTLLASAVKPDGSLPLLEFGGHDVCSDCHSIPHPVACFFCYLANLTSLSATLAFAVAVAQILS